MERITPQNATPATARVKGLVKELEKNTKKQLDIDDKLFYLITEPKETQTDKMRDSAKSLEFESRRLKTLVNHIEQSLYQARLFPVIHQNKLLKA